MSHNKVNHNKQVINPLRNHNKYNNEFDEEMAEIVKRKEKEKEKEKNINNTLHENEENIGFQHPVNKANRYAQGYLPTEHWNSKRKSEKTTSKKWMNYIRHLVHRTGGRRTRKSRRQKTKKVRSFGKVR